MRPLISEKTIFNKIMRSLVHGALTIAILQIYHIVLAEDAPPETRTQTQVIKKISADEAFVLIDKNKNNSNLVILDVRTPEEFNGGHIENAINLDFYSETFKDDINKLDRNKLYITHCAVGGRSAKTVEIMKDLDFIQVYYMIGGIAEWKSKGFPTEKQEEN
ncbi:MAG TPA: rhodanese-like domain-containing protein [Thermodesulfobacteriota bacterium]|jgi:rhodanese-related sulfurtransferase